MKGQILLITVFGLTFALFSIYTVMTPIKDKLLRIKELESIYQAIANSEKGLEVSLYDVFKKVSIGLNKNQISNVDLLCGGLNFNLQQGNCVRWQYNNQGNLWLENEKFVTNIFVFRKQERDLKIKMKAISDGFSGKNIRTIFIGPGR